MIVNDIEKMKREFEEKLALAIKENEINEGIEEYKLRLTDRNRIYIPSEYVSLKGFVKPSIQNVADLLNRFPKNKNTLYGNNKEFDLPYICYSKRSYGDKSGEFSIYWTHNEYEVGATMEIDNFIPEFFIRGTRETNECENSTYASIQRFDSNGYYCMYSVPVYDFKKRQQCYYGGGRLLLDIEEIERIVNFIKSKSL